MAIAGQLTSAGLLSLVSQPPTLEELFMRHYQISANSSAPMEVTK